MTHYLTGPSEPAAKPIFTVVAAAADAELEASIFAERHVREAQGGTLVRADTRHEALLIPQHICVHGAHLRRAAISSDEVVCRAHRQPIFGCHQVVENHVQFESVAVVDGVDHGSGHFGQTVAVPCQCQRLRFEEEVARSEAESTQSVNPNRAVRTDAVAGRTGVHRVAFVQWRDERTHLNVFTRTWVHCRDARIWRGGQVLFTLDSVVHD